MLDARYRRSENLHASGRDTWSAHAQPNLQIAKMRVRVRWTENNKNPNVEILSVFFLHEDWCAGWALVGSAVHARATQSRTRNYLESLNTKSPLTSPRAHVILFFPYCRVGLSSMWCMYSTITWIHTDRSPPTPRNLPTDLEVSGKIMDFTRHFSCKVTHAHLMIPTDISKLYSLDTFQSDINILSAIQYDFYGSR